MSPPSNYLARAVADYGAAVQGRAPRRACVILEFDDGETLEVKLPERAMIVASAESPAAIPVEQAVVAELEALPAGRTLTGEELASRTGYSNGGWFRGVLADMARDGKIVSNGRRGYSAVPVAG